VQAYSWSLRDVIERGLFPFLFAEDDVRDANFGAVVLDIENWLTHEKLERDNTRRRTLADRPGNPRTFQELLDQVQRWATGDEARPCRNHHAATMRELYRRLLRLVYEGNGVLRRDGQTGKPLEVTARDSREPVVVDLNGLSAVPSLQRFVVATIFRQLVDE